jgi:P-type Ca2+ transporter type 2C
VTEVSNVSSESSFEEAPHALERVRASALLGSDLTQGLSSARAAELRRVHGDNALPEKPARSTLAVFAGQFASPLIYLLFGAAAVSFSLGHFSDGVVICVVVLLNAVIGAVQEGRAERSLSALLSVAATKARVVRDGRLQTVEARTLVPGDLIALEAGDAVTADARITEAAQLQVAEAALTGESVPSQKQTEPVPVDTPVADRSNMLFAGTNVTSGRARGLVTSTGTHTEIGRIARLADDAHSAPTPLEARVAHFGRLVIYAAVGIFALVLGVGYLDGIPLAELLMVAISQVVGMIPEGLPVAVTIALAIGVQRMARRRAVVRKLSAIETLGSTTVICSDKTGTLTKNEMTVTELHLADGSAWSVSGIGYGPRGDLRRRGDGRAPDAPAAEPPPPELRVLLEAALLCNDAELHLSREGEPQPVGDPTEVALVTLALKAGVTPREVREAAPRLAELPFDSATKLMATSHQRGEHTITFAKGAPEALLDRCTHRLRDGRAEPLDAESRALLERAAAGMARAALRVLALAQREGPALDPSQGIDGLGDGLVLLGLVGQIDPPRDEVKTAVAQCREAGVRAVMVTGDHKATGVAIAEALGIADAESTAVDGTELARMDDAALDAVLPHVAVFARVHPAQKLRIIEAYQRRGEVVAMTGDGVNDAPALARADVGVAMGITGTDVAKQAAKVVIADDDFATIVAAVEEGRVVYRNIKKAVLLLFSTSAAEVLVLLGALVLGYPPPLAAVQILWNNLVTEGLITVNLVMEPAEGDEMRSPPVPRSEPLVPRTMMWRLILMTTTITAVSLGWFLVRTRAGLPAAQVATETFTLITICEWYNVLNCRSERQSAFGLGLLRNPFLLGGIAAGALLQLLVVYVPVLNGVFKTVPLGVRDALLLAVVGSAVLWVEELRKLALRHGLPPAAGPHGRPISQRTLASSGALGPRRNEA